MVLVLISQEVLDLQNGAINSRKNESWLAGRVSPDKDRVWFFKGSLEIFSGRLWTYLDENGKTVIRVDQLSETKVCRHWYVNKSITALFTTFGFYWC